MPGRAQADYLGCTYLPSLAATSTGKSHASRNENRDAGRAAGVINPYLRLRMNETYKYHVVVLVGNAKAAKSALAEYMQVHDGPVMIRNFRPEHAPEEPPAEYDLETPYARVTVMTVEQFFGADRTGSGWTDYRTDCVDRSRVRDQVSDEQLRDPKFNVGVFV